MHLNARIIICTLLISLLSGCWVPEQFNAKILINKDGSYTFTYEGTLAFALALASAQKDGLSAKDEAAFKQAAESIARVPGFQRVDYLGKWRYKAVVKKVCKPGEPYYFLSKDEHFFSVVPKKDGTISISAFRPDKKGVQELNSLGIKIDGTLTVLVASGAKVIKHNAESQPLTFGQFDSYKWDIKSPDKNPIMIVQPATTVGGTQSDPVKPKKKQSEYDRLMKETKTGGGMRTHF